MVDQRAIRAGEPYPLGATPDGGGANFALFSENAEAVELCLFDGNSLAGEERRIPVRERTDGVWHCYIPGIGPGQLYGYRVHGPYDPENGHRFNPNKLLLDPYARETAGTLDWSYPHLGYKPWSKKKDLSFDDRDNAAGVPKSRIPDGKFDWGEDRPPRTPWQDTVIYELHVKGFTRQHPDVPEEIRGTYAGLATDAAINHLTDLGVTAVELLPVHGFVQDARLVKQDLANYWGYNSLSFFAPEMRYSATGTIDEFKSMVKRLHAAGLEVILDVVYNHTAEGNHLGPTLSFKGLDNAAYYRLMPEDRRYYKDFSGTGNTLDLTHPRVLQLVMDSLRYWVEEMHVDGFRFDLASALAREHDGFDPRGGFLDAIRQDPTLSRVKLIAEPWDVGAGGYQVGGFPSGWSEWNGKYRDAVRAYWKGEPGLVGELASRITGSSDIYEPSGRRPTASVNFITAHDGFTLQDLVSYNDKHNEANGENNRDGENHNHSHNHGAEGPTDDPEVRSLRARQKRNLLTTLLLSQGVPMLLSGDELGNSQGGNNNAYCQDNDISWIDWELIPEEEDFLVFVRSLLRLRREHPVFRQAWFLRGRDVDGEPGIKDVVWLTAEGNEVGDGQWHDVENRFLGVQLSGVRGEAERDDFLLLFNAHHEEEVCTLPRLLPDARWEVVIDTGRPADAASGVFKPGDEYRLADRSVAVFSNIRRAEDEG